MEYRLYLRECIVVVVPADSCVFLCKILMEEVDYLKNVVHLAIPCCVLLALMLAYIRTTYLLRSWLVTTKEVAQSNVLHVLRQALHSRNIETGTHCRPPQGGSTASADSSLIGAARLVCILQFKREFTIVPLPPATGRNMRRLSSPAMRSTSRSTLVVHPPFAPQLRQRACATRDRPGRSREAQPSAAEHPPARALRFCTHPPTRPPPANGRPARPPTARLHARLCAPAREPRP